MNKEEDYASDSDQSDEDFCPDKAVNSDAGSEEESDDPISENEDEPVSVKKTTKTKNKTTKKPKKTVEKAPAEEEHVITTRNRTDTATKSTVEKDELESDEEDPSKKDALWADFLNDVEPPTRSESRRPASSSSRSATSRVEKEKPAAAEVKKMPEPPKEPEKVVVTQIFEFAGEEVRVEKAVSADSLKENAKKTPVSSSGAEAARGSVKRPAGGGGLGSILGQIGKKKKISVLEKTKLDWDTFKTTEGIAEELQTFNKGKDGYLQRQDFLERTDLRQFEIEKSIRQAKRKPM